MGKSPQSLDALRAELAELDRRLVELVERRQRLASRIGSVKAERGIPTRDYRQEREVYERVRREAESCGIDARVVEDLFALLIRSSLARQERDRVEARSSGSGRRALVIGGAGRMGGWFARFLDSQGFTVEIADPSDDSGTDAAESFPRHREWRDAGLDQDVVVVAAPLENTAEILEGLALAAPPGLVFDVASLKGPLREPLEALAAAGVRATSIHPMFGPDTELLANRHVIFVDLGSKAATAEAKALFSSTMANLVDMELADHDRLIAFVLGLSHALNLAFADALSSSGEEVPHLAEISSTTFDAQLEIASRVASENPRLYFEIQAFNEFGDQPLEALGDSVERLRRLVSRGDGDGFVELMLAGRRYLRERRG